MLFHDSYYIYDYCCFFCRYCTLLQSDGSDPPYVENDVVEAVETTVSREDPIECLNSTVGTQVLSTTLSAVNELV